MKVFLDTDVILDVLLGRRPFYDHSASVLDWSQRHPGQTAVSWHGAANLYYLNGEGGTAFLEDLLDFCDVPATGAADLRWALGLTLSDLEDAMQCAAAFRFGADVICTRKLRDYRGSPIEPLTPRDLIPRLPA